MNKGDLIERVAEKVDLTKVEAKKAVDEVFDAISDSLAAGDDVQLIGFGTFSVSERAARTGRNPMTGEKIEIKAQKGIKFKAGKRLKENVQ